MNKIIVYSEIMAEKVTDASLELISKAYELKLQSNTEFQKDILVEAVVIALELDELSKQRIYKAGADRIIFIKDTDGDIAEEHMGAKVGQRYAFNKINEFETTLI